MSAFLISIDVAAGAFFLSRAFPAVVHMGRRTLHRFRCIYVLLALGSAAMIVSPMMDVEWRRYAHVGVIAALALQEWLDRRRADRACRRFNAPADRRQGVRP